MVVPPFSKPLDRRGFIRATVIRITLYYIATDILESLIKVAPGGGSHNGGSIFVDGMPSLQRYLFSTMIHSATGLTFLAGFTMLHEIGALLDVWLLGHSPTNWPPIFDAPWLSTSLSQFWSRRWHQLLRSTFLDIGGYPLGYALSPLGKTAERCGLVMGSFIASGALHDFGMWNVNREFHADALVFFTAQGLLVILEYVFQLVTTRRVGGWPGRIWAYAMIILAGQPMGTLTFTSQDRSDAHSVDAWHKQGILSGEILPPQISIARRLLFPMIQSLYARLQSK